MAIYQIDPQHTAAHFKVRHMMISNVKGEFSGITGLIEFDPANLAVSHAEATINAATVNTREPERDKHLKSADFFDVANHPTMTFKSTKVEADGTGKLRVTGDLTIRGNTKTAALEVTVPKSPIKDPWGL